MQDVIEYTESEIRDFELDVQELELSDLEGVSGGPNYGGG
jgi:hypothetical protein